MLYPCDCRHTLVAILPWFVNTCQERALDEVSLHTLTSSLAAWQEEFTHPDFCDVVFDQFLLPLVSHTSVMRHTLRLLSYIFPKLDPQKVLHILTIAQPSSEVCTMYSWFCVVFLIYALSWEVTKHKVLKRKLYYICQPLYLTTLWKRWHFLNNSLRMVRNHFLVSTNTCMSGL